MPKHQEMPKLEDANSLESLAELEDSVKTKRGPVLAPVAHAPKSQETDFELEAVDLHRDGKIKIVFTQGLEVIIDSEHRAFKTKGISLRFGPLHIKATQVSDVYQIVIDSIQINLKR